MVNVILSPAALMLVALIPEEELLSSLLFGVLLLLNVALFPLKNKCVVLPLDKAFSKSPSLASSRSTNFGDCASQLLVVSVEQELSISLTCPVSYTHLTLPTKRIV